MNFKKLMEMVCGDVGIGGMQTEPGEMSADTYATGDARIPYNHLSGKKHIGGKKKNRKPKIMRRSNKLW